MSKFVFLSQARSNLYYQKYQYCVVIWIHHASMLRKLAHKDIDFVASYRNRMIKDRPRWLKEVTTGELASLHEVCDYFLNCASEYKKVVSGNFIWIYTNQPQDWEDIVACSGVILSKATQADPCLPANVIVRRYPRHQYRTYFRELWPDEDQQNNIRRFFLARPQQFSPSTSFELFLLGKRLWVCSHYFVDHNDAGLAFFINMACPGLVAKTMPIVARDK